MQSAVKPPEKREHEPEKDKSKVRSKKPTNAVSIPALLLVPMDCRCSWVSLGYGRKSHVIYVTLRTLLSS